MTRSGTPSNPTLGDATPWAAALPPLLAGFAMFALAGVERDAQAAAEGHYLALAATTVLLAAAGVARRPLGAPALALPVLAVVAFITFPPDGAARGAAMGALLCLGPAALLVDGLVSRRAELFEPPGSLEPARLLRLGVLLAAALIGLNLLLRQGDLLAGSTPRLLVVLVAIPAAAAVVVLVLFARLGAPALAGTAALLLAAGGVRSNVVLVLAAAACADALARALEQRWPAVAGAAGLALAAVVGLVLVREPAFGVLIAAMAAAIVWRRFAFAIVLVLAGALTVWQPLGAAAPWPDVLAGLPLVLIAAPSLIGRGNLQTVTAAVLLALAGLRFLPPQQALLASIALWTVLYAKRSDGLSADDPPPVGPWHSLALRGDAAVFGYCLQGGLLAFATLSATYPWLQPAHLEDRLRAFGLGGGLEHWSALAGILLLAHGSASLVRRTPAPRVLVLALAAVLLTTAALGAWDAFQPRRTLLSSPRQVLTADNPRWTAPGGGCGKLILDTALANSGGVAAGQPVGRIGVGDVAGPETAILRHGDQTGEWSARASGDIAGLKPWLHWVAAGESEPFFGTRYRTEVDLTPFCGKGDLVVVRDPELPEPVELTLFFALQLGRPGA
ncbi:MAG: hypothetical protein F4Y16_15440 [Holophagales bacterium]|nr:hypothetical protein [Holophagales bacterium]MYH26791.1 hypothetical protein [Holophagales bacterium]